MDDPVRTDVLILGGWPAGSTAATLLVRAADDVTAALRRKGRVDAADVVGTARLVRNMHRLFFSLIRSYDDPHFLALFFRPRPALRIPEAVISVLAGDVLRRDRRRLIARFRLLQGLAALQRLGAALGRPLVPPLAHTPAGTP